MKFLGILFLFISQLAFAQNVDWRKYDHLDPQRVVPTAALRKAVAYYDQINAQYLQNKSYISIIDFSKHSSIPRYYLIHVPSGMVRVFLVAHGIGSEPQLGSGMATEFSNIEGSLMSSLGFYITDNTYMGKNGFSLRINGIERSNDQARKRAVVVHGADYVKDGMQVLGNSEGCFVLDFKWNTYVINRIANGSLMLAWKN